jgi:hypothetical protein
VSLGVPGDIPDPGRAVRYNFGQVNVLPAGSLARIPDMPRDRTLLRDRGSDEVVVMAGGAKFHISGPGELEALGYNFGQVNVLPAGSLARIPDMPVDGTLLRERSASDIFMVHDGQRTPAPRADPRVVQVVPNGSLVGIPVVPTPSDPSPSDPSPSDPSPSDPTAPSIPSAARAIDAACPTDRVPANPFVDVRPGSTHERAISCLVWWKVASGRSATSYAPGHGVTRDAMATFIARAILTVKPGSLPDDPTDAFADDNSSVHQKAINQLAAVGVIGGTGNGNYSPAAVVSRGQMARFLANAAEQVLGQPLPTDRDFFSDDNGSLFGANINRVAQAGITGGRSDGTYNAAGPVLRDQMGSFLARTLDLFVTNGSRLPQ